MPRVESKNTAGTVLLRRGLLGLAIGLGLFFLVRAVLTFIEPSRAYKISDVAPSRLSASNGGAATQRAAVFNPAFDAFHRGGENIVVDVAAPVIGEDAPETDLNLTLTGLTVLGGGRGSAILRLPDGAEASYTIDDTILRNVKLEAVYPAHIIISRGGAQERVTFERASGTLFQNESETTGGADTPNPLTQAKVQTLSQGLDARAQQALEGFTPQTFFNNIRPSPVRENGEVIGYRLRSKNRARLDLSDLGYESGDIVTHVGGTDLRQGLPNFKDLEQQFIRNPSAASLTLNRKGEAITLRLK